MKIKKKNLIVTLCCIFAICLLAGTICLLFANAETGEVQFETIEAKQTYGLGESITLEPITATYKGEKYSVSGKLTFDGEKCAEVGKEESFVNYIFDKTGEYVLTYSLNIDGKVYSHCKYINVEDRPYFNDQIKSRYQLGAELPINNIYAVSGEEKVKADVYVNGVKSETYAARSLGELEIVLSAFIKGAELKETRKTVIYLDDYSDLFINNDNLIESGHSAPEWAHAENGQPYKGVLLRSERKDDAIRFSNIINLNDLGKDDALIRFLPISGVYEGEQYSHLSSVSVKLIDVYNPNNFVTYRSFSSMYYEDGGCNLYTQICYGNIAMARWNFGEFDTFREYLINNASTLDIESKKENNRKNIMWLTFSLDYKTKNFYTNLDANEKAEAYNILPANDPAVVGVGNQWKGFTTGEVYLEIEFESSGYNNGILIREIGGQMLSSETIEDNTVPTAIFEYEELPDGFVGRTYPVLYSQKIYDSTLGVLDNSHCCIELWLIAGNKFTDYTDKVVEGKFVPEKAGTYRVTYIIEDDAGNVKTYFKNFEIYEAGLIAAAVNPFKSEGYLVGESLILPDVGVENMSIITDKKIIYKYDGQILNMKAGDELFFDKAGTLEIVYDITDYNGTSVKGSFSAQVKISKDPIVKIGRVPDVAVCGLPLYLPTFEAYDYNYSPDEEGFIPQKTISVNGNIVDGPTYNVTEQDGNCLNIVYKAGIVEHKLSIPVIKAVYLADYFNAVSESGSVQKNNAEESVDFTFNNDAVISPYNPCVINGSENVLTRFDFSERQGKLKISLIDYVDESKVVEFYFDFSAGTVTNDNITYELPDDVVTVNYNMKKQLFSGLSMVTHWSDGTEFNGFNVNLYKIKFEFSDCGANTVFQLYKLSASNLQTKRNEDGSLKEYSYNGVPYLVMSESVDVSGYVLGGQLKVPKATAWLPFGGMLYVDVVVKNKNDEAICEKLPAINNNYITIENYGQYMIEYSMHTPSGKIRSKTLPVELRCSDIPEIVVTSEIKSTYKLGEEIGGIEFQVNGIGNINSKVFLVNAKGNVIPIGNTDVIKLEMPGTHKIVVLAQDDWNYAAKVITFKVER